MILIDGKEIDWTLYGNGGYQRFAEAMTWKLAKGLYKWNTLNKRYDVPNIILPSEYVATFKYGLNGDKRKHKVEYQESLVPHPTKDGAMIRLPQTVSIERGVIVDQTDADLNFFFYYAPWRSDGPGYDKKWKPKVVLHDTKKLGDKMELDAEITMSVLRKVSELSLERPGEIIAMARLVRQNSTYSTGIRIDEGLLDSADTDDNRSLKMKHLADLKNSLISFAHSRPKYAKTLLDKKEADIYGIIEKAKQSKRLQFVYDASVAGVMGKWVYRDSMKEVDLCVVRVDERPTDRLFRMLANPDTSEKKQSAQAFTLLREAPLEPVLE